MQRIENFAFGDEGFSLYIAKAPQFSSIFSDAGNPPFYFLLIKLEYLLFHFNVLGFKLTSVAFNIGTIIFLWHVLKRKFGIKTANFGALIGALNLVMTYYSHEIRCYSLTMLLSVAVLYLTCVPQNSC